MIYKPFNLVLVIQIVYAWWRKNVIMTYSIYPIVEYLIHDLDELLWTINEKEPKFNEEQL